MTNPSKEIQDACRVYIDSIKGEAWYSPDLDDIILDAFWEGMCRQKGVASKV